MNALPNINSLLREYLPMGKNYLLLLIVFFTSQSFFSQTSNDESVETKQITTLENSNQWAIGAGVSNFIMHGDLRSVGTDSFGTFLNFGGYVYINKMFNPILGLEFKIAYNRIAGAALNFSEAYGSPLYAETTSEGKSKFENLFFKGNTYGVEANFVFSFSNLYEANAEKWHFSGYLGLGYHKYDTALYERLSDGSDFLHVNFKKNSERSDLASSIYLSGQVGIKRKLSKRVDLELRSGIYFNYDDHLDGAISRKQDWETFFVTNLGLAIKLGKSKEFSIWGKKDLRKEKFEIIDTDRDGVLDQLDIQPNTPRGVMVYANGEAVDSDKDGTPDYKDKCPFVKGLINNDGCPFAGDRDKDGVSDRDDKCPDVKGLEKYQGCPDEESLRVKEIVTILKYSKNVYFDTASNDIKSAYYYTMLDEVASIMLKNKDITFSVSGYTDDRGKADYNLALSQRRAEQARAYLIVRGVESDRVSAKGYGEVNPKFTNKTEQGRQLNRRVEIKSVGVYKQRTKVYMPEDK